MGAVVMVTSSSTAATTSGVTPYPSGPFVVGAHVFDVQPTPSVPVTTASTLSSATVMLGQLTQNFVVADADAVRGSTFPVAVTVTGVPLTTAATLGSTPATVKSTVDGAAPSTAVVACQSSTTSTSSDSSSGPPAGTSTPPPTSNGSTTSPSSSTTSASPSSPPVVVVRQFQTVRPYSANTSWKLFRDHFRQVAKVNSWTTPDELIQHLTLSLEGPAAELLRDFDDTAPTAVNDLWERLNHRFGDVDECSEAMRTFEARRQSNTESLVEFEQALRSLFKVAWPTASSETRDATLKRRFEDDVLSSELSQYLRLHHRDLTNK